jgi:hypothetical protein
VALEECELYFQTQALVSRAIGSSRRSYAQAVAGIPMQNSFSTLRDESDDVPVGAEFLGTDGVRLGSVLNCDLRKVARRAVPARGHQG